MKKLFVCYERTLYLPSATPSSQREILNSVLTWEEKIEGEESIKKLQEHLKSLINACIRITIINFRRME